MKTAKTMTPPSWATRMRRQLLVTSTILCSSFAAPAWAQNSPDDWRTAPVRQSVDANGVDLFSGAVNVDGPEISAGDPESDQGLSWRKFKRDDAQGNSLAATLTINPSETLVGIANNTDRFTLSGGSYLSSEGNGSTLSLSGSVYTYTASDGTVARFNERIVNGVKMGLVFEIERPSREKRSYAYQAMTYCPQVSERGCLQSQTAYRISSIESSSGYRLTFQNAPIPAFDPSDAFSVPWAQWKTWTGVTLVNTKVPGDTGRSQTFTSTAAPDTIKPPASETETITDALGRVTKYRKVNGRVAGVTEPGSTAEDLTIAYNDVGRVTSVTHAAGKTTYAYSDSGNMRTVTVTDPANNPLVFGFDISLQRMTSARDALGNVTSWAYDAKGRVTRATAPEGNYVQYTYDARGNVIETRSVAKPSSGLADVVTTAGYDASCNNPATCNKPKWTKDAKGNQTDFTYDGTNGHVTTATAPPDAAGVRALTSYTYADVGGALRLSRVTTCTAAATCPGSANERVTTIAYDGNGLPTAMTNQAGDGAIGSTTTAAYDAAGNRISVDGPLGGAEDTAQYRYDAARQLVGEISPDPDGTGPMIRRATRSSYDPRGRVVLVEQGTASDTGDAGWATFAPMQQVARTYDGVDRILSETASAGGTVYSVIQNSYVGERLDCTAIRLNAAERGNLPASACTLQTITADGPDRITKYAYDRAGRVEKVTAGFGTSAAINEVSTTYTPNGEAATVTDANGNVTAYGYDGYDRLRSTTFPGGSFEQLGYDLNSNVISRRLRDGNNIAYGHDALNRVTSVTVPKLDANEHDRTYNYDLAGKLVRAADASGRFITLTYDALGRQVSETSSVSTRHFAYDAAGRRTRLTWQDGFFVSYDYLVTGETSAIRENGSTVLAAFGYDNLGRRTSLTRGNGVTTTYSYDAASRLTGMVNDLSGTANDVSTTFTYNQAGQIASRTRSNSDYAWNETDAIDRPYTINALNQYTQAGPVAFGYDGRGNLTSSGTTTYGYTSENRLGSGPGGYLAYDPLGRLYDENGQLTLQYDGANLITEQTASGIARRYVFGPGTDEPLVWYEGSGTGDKRWLVADERGSVVAVTDAAANAIAINRYDDYGIPGSANVGRFQYTGQTWLPAFGLYNYKARIYSPTLGRFLQTDPIGYGDGMNLYTYAGNDPINGTDPTGTEIVVTAVVVKVTILEALPAVFSGIGGIFSSIFGGGPSKAVRLQREQRKVEQEQQQRAAQADDEIVVTAQKSLGQCIAEQLGVGEIMSGGAAASGFNVVPTRGKFAGATPGTSVASRTAGAVFGKAEFKYGGKPVRLPSLTGWPRAVGGAGVGLKLSSSVARVVGRGVPVLGWALLAYDAYSVASCALGDE